MVQPTVGELFSKWDGLRKEARVWEYLKDSLDRTMRMSRDSSEVPIIKMADGRPVESEIMIRVLSDIDGAISDIEEQAKAIEAQSVGQE
jgi:hypothetical protein